MDSNPRRDTALTLLAATGMRKSNYAPPLFRLLWRAGFDIPPPHFMSFGARALLLGGFFGVGWGFFMALFMKVRPVALMLASLAAGLLFGCAMAAYHAYERRKHRLPAWDSLADGQ
jgi:Family of unknown function (DUF6404)